VFFLILQAMRLLNQITRRMFSGKIGNEESIRRNSGMAGVSS
jgi:hypothetical protein